MLVSLNICLRLSIVFTILTTSKCNDDEHNYINHIAREDLETRYNAEDEHSINYWIEQGRAFIRNKIATPEITNTAKNVIFFIGDGMSIPTITASRIYFGQLNGSGGENSKLSFETFPHTGLAKTYCVSNQVPDSACTSTAFLGGVKSNYGTLGVNAKVERGSCEAANDPGNRVTTMLAWAQAAGKGTGVVTTTRITNATPAGAYAHSAERDLESDYDVSISKNPEASKCIDIAKQLVFGDPGKYIKVIFGGGRSNLMPNTTPDHEHKHTKGKRLDGVNLIEEWKQLKANMNVTSEFVWNREQLLNTDVSKTQYLMGLFETDHMHFHMHADPATEPTLADMTTVAIKMLQKEPKGYFLFVEGGRIDRAHHNTWAHLALDETVEFHKAVQAAVELTDVKDTLIVVTSDHAHTMSFSGYPARGDDVLTTDLSQDDANYTVISYANGPSVEFLCNKSEVTDCEGNGRLHYPSIIKIKDETHGGDDVAVFARGPWSHLFTGTMEQNVIALTMAYAAGIDPEDVQLRYISKSSATKMMPTGICIILFCTLFRLNVYAKWTNL